jgi:hypothetical protein
MKFVWTYWQRCLHSIVLVAGVASGLCAQGVRDTSQNPDKVPCESTPNVFIPCDSTLGSRVECDAWGECGCSQPVNWEMRGWLNGGLYLNGQSPPSRFNGIYNQTDYDGGMLNQVYAIAEKAVEKSDATILGGRMDVLYGRDFILAQSLGIEANPGGGGGWNKENLGLAIPQAYASIGNRDAYLKVGHFYTLIGYEGVPAPVNFFYSKSNSYMFAGPFTHWGTVGTWNASDNLSIDAGLVNGWNGFDRTSDSVSFLNRMTLGSQATRTKLSVGVITGNEANNNFVAYTNRTRYSVILTQDMGERTQYVFHQWLGVQDRFFSNGSNAAWYGLDQYLFYTISSKLRSALRLEWFRDEDGVRLGLNRPSNPNKPPYVGDLYSISTGINWQGTKSFVVRPEMRYDWFTGSGNPFNDNKSTDQFVTGLDAIWMF